MAFLRYKIGSIEQMQRYSNKGYDLREKNTTEIVLKGKRAEIEIATRDLSFQPHSRNHPMHILGRPHMGL